MRGLERAGTQKETWYSVFPAPSLDRKWTMELIQKGECFRRLGGSAVPNHSGEAKKQDQLVYELASP